MPFPARPENSRIIIPAAARDSNNPHYGKDIPPSEFRVLTASKIDLRTTHQHGILRFRFKSIEDG